MAPTGTRIEMALETLGADWRSLPLALMSPKGRVDP